MRKVIEGEIELYSSFNKYLLNTCYLPGTVLRAEDTEANKPDIFDIMIAYILVEEAANKI